MKIPGLTHLRRCREERGSGTVMALALILLGVGIILAVSTLGVAVAGSSAAHTASDLAAIAGATDLLEGGDGCGVAREYASKNAAVLTDCRREGWLLTVRVRKPLGVLGAAQAVSRAGPEFAAASLENRHP